MRSKQVKFPLIAAFMLLALGWALAGGEDVSLPRPGEGTEESETNDQLEKQQENLPPAKHAILFLNGGDAPDKHLLARLGKQGFASVVRKINQPLSQEYLRLFDVVVLHSFEGLAPGTYTWKLEFFTEYREVERNLDALLAYAQAGGGLLLNPGTESSGEMAAQGWEPILRPLGASMLPEQIRDSSHATGLKCYAWTTAIEKHPVTEQVAKLLYPTNSHRWDDMFSTVPIRLDAAEWNPLAKAMPGADSGYLMDGKWIMKGRKEPAFLAVRQYGKGNAAVFGISPYYWLTAPFAQPSISAPNDFSIGERNTGPIDGIFLDKGDGQDKGDGWALVQGLLTWLAESSQAKGMGGYSEEKAKAAPLPAALKPADIGLDKPGGPVKMLIGARSSYSDGSGSIADYAKAAREGGYGILAMTETFEALLPARWEEFVKACDAASSKDLLVLPGLDISDPYGNRFLLIGNRFYPKQGTLSPDGKRLVMTQFLSLGFGRHFTIAHRPSTTPLPQEMLKFYNSISVATYRDGELADDGFMAYQWAVANFSRPVPMAVHEIYSPGEVEKEAANGMQSFISARTPADALLFLMGNTYFSNPPYYVSSGPKAQLLTGNSIMVSAETKLREVRLINSFATWERWTPGTNQADLDFYLPRGDGGCGFFRIEDSAGGVAITPGFAQVGAGNGVFRCSDRQNWLGDAAIYYTGTKLLEVNPRLSAFGTAEGTGLFPREGHPLGENLCPALSFPLVSNAVLITQGTLGLRYYDADWSAVAYDAKPSRGMTRARVYEGRVRLLDFRNTHHKRLKSGDPIYGAVRDIKLRTLMPVVPQGDVFPVVRNVGANPVYMVGEPAKLADAEMGKRKGKALPTGDDAEGADNLDEEEKLDSPASAKEVVRDGYVDLPPGSSVGGMIVLTPGLRVNAKGDFGFAAPQTFDAPLPEDTEWQCQYVLFSENDAAFERRYTGLSCPPPFSLEIKRGKLDQLAYIAHLTADKQGIAAQKKADKYMLHTLPIQVTGIQPNWTAGVVADTGALTPCPVFEGAMWAQLDMAKDAIFFAGNPIVCDQPELRIIILEWQAKSAQNGGFAKLSLHNPTDSSIHAKLRLQQDIPKLDNPSQSEADVPPGSSLAVEMKW